MNTKIMKTMDGNEAAAYISYAFTEVATIYPITPSSPMAEHVDSWSANGKKNIFGQTVRLVEMESEAGAASPFSLARAAEAVSQPVSCPMISTTVMEGNAYTLQSQAISVSVVPIYFAAEPKPGEWSVSGRSFSMAFGTPMILISLI